MSRHNNKTKHRKGPMWIWTLPILAVLGITMLGMTLAGFFKKGRKGAAAHG